MQVIILFKRQYYFVGSYQNALNVNLLALRIAVTLS